MFVGASLSAAVAAVGCSRATPAATVSSALQRANSSGQLRAAYISYPPSLVVDPSTKSIAGIMHDVMALVSQSLDLKLDYSEETTWATMIETVETGRADLVVTGLWPSARRARRAVFSDPIYYSPVKAYVRAGDVRFTGDIAAANDPAIRIATIDGELSATIAAESFVSAIAASLPQSTDVSQLLLQLTTNKADLTFVETAIAEEFIAKNGNTIAAVEDVPAVRLFPNTIMAAAGETGLMNAINVALRELHFSGAILRILQKYDPETRLFVPVRTPLD